MPSTENTNYSTIAHYLAKDFHRFGFVRETKPLAHALRFDGSLSVVAANGMKFIFTPEEVKKAIEELAITPPAPKKAPSAPKKTR